LSALVKDADVTVVLNRVGFEGAVDNLLTGDKVTISTADPRGLLFFTVGSWVDGEGVEQRTLFTIYQCKRCRRACGFSPHLLML
jgi:hypothetical protein